MSVYDKGHRDSATRGNYAKVTAGEAMKFRVLGVRPVYNAKGPNGDFECAPHEVHLYWHRNKAGQYEEVNDVREWEPAADKIDGLIKLADSLEASTRNPRALFEADVIVEVSEAINPKTKRTYHVYAYRVDGAAPAASAAPPAPPPSTTPPRTNLPPATTPPATVPPPPVPGAAPAVPSSQDALDACRNGFALCANIEALKAKVRELWPKVQAAHATAAATVLFNERKIGIAKTLLAQAPGLDAMNAEWARVAPEFERDPAGMQAITTAYQERAAAFTAAGGDDIPF